MLFVSKIIVVEDSWVVSGTPGRRSLVVEAAQVTSMFVRAATKRRSEKQRQKDPCVFCFFP